MPPVQRLVSTLLLLLSTVTLVPPPELSVCVRLTGSIAIEDAPCPCEAPALASNSGTAWGDSRGLNTCPSCVDVILGSSGPIHRSTGTVASVPLGPRVGVAAFDLGPAPLLSAVHFEVFRPHAPRTVLTHFLRC